MNWTDNREPNISCNYIWEANRPERNNIVLLRTIKNASFVYSLTNRALKTLSPNLRHTMRVVR